MEQPILPSSVPTKLARARSIRPKKDLRPPMQPRTVANNSEDSGSNHSDSMPLPHKHELLLDSKTVAIYATDNMLLDEARNILMNHFKDRAVDLSI